MTRRSLCLVFALALAHAAAVAAWHARDRAAPTRPEARALLASHRMAEAIAHPDVDLLRRLATAHPDGDAPMLPAVAALFQLAAPEDLDGPRHATIVFVFVLVLATFGLGRRAAMLVGARCPNAAGLLASFLAAGSTLVANEGHRLLPHVPIAAGSALVAGGWLATEGFAHRRASLLFGAAAAIALLSSWWTALALVAPAIDVLLVLSSGPGARKRIANAALALSVPALAVTPFVLHLPEEVGSAPTTALSYRFRPTAEALTEVLGVPLVAFGVAGALAAAVRLWRARREEPAAWPQAARLVALGLVPIGLAGRSWIPASYAAAALAPVLAAFASGGIATLPRLALRVGIGSAAVASTALAFFASSFDAFAGSESVVARVASAITTRRDPPDPRDRNATAVLRAIDRDRAGAPARVCVIAPQDEVSGAVFEALAAARFEGIRAEAFPEPKAEPMPFLPLSYLGATHVLVARRRGGTDMDEGRVHPCNAGMSRYVASGAPALTAHLRRVHRAEFVRGAAPSDRDLVFEVYRRVQPADDAEIAELLASGTTFARIASETWVEIAYVHYVSGDEARARAILEANAPPSPALPASHRALADRIRGAP